MRVAVLLFQRSSSENAWHNVMGVVHALVGEAGGSGGLDHAKEEIQIGLRLNGLLGVSIPVVQVIYK